MHRGRDSRYGIHHRGVVIDIFERNTGLGLGENRGTEMSYIEMENFDAKLKNFQVESFGKSWVELV